MFVGVAVTPLTVTIAGVLKLWSTIDHHKCSLISIKGAHLWCKAQSKGMQESTEEPTFSNYSIY